MDLEKRLGQYTIVRPIGSGGMGQVYEAVQDQLYREVALKVLDAKLAKQSEHLVRFRREAQAAALLNHPNIITVYEFGRDQDRFFFSMELVRGESLKERIDREGALPTDEALDLVTQACRGLARAWELGHLHRDIKPGNLLITTDGIVKVSDFGLALLAHSANKDDPQGPIMGTPSYMSPERAVDAEAQDYHSDVYSLGATLYHCLTGVPPFTGNSNDRILRNVARRPVRPVRELKPDIPGPLAETVGGMLAKEPDQRCESPSELLERLESLKRAISEGEGAPRGDSPADAGAEAGPPGPAPQGDASGVDAQGQTTAVVRKRSFRRRARGKLRTAVMLLIILAGAWFVPTRLIAIKLSNRGVELVEEGELEGALASYEQALRIHPLLTTARTNFILLATELADSRRTQPASYARAASLYERLLRIGYRGPRIRYKLAMLYARQYRLDSALAELRTQLEEYPEDEEARELLRKLLSEEDW